MKESGQNLIKKILPLIIFPLAGIICRSNIKIYILYKNFLKSSSPCIKHLYKHLYKLWIAYDLQKSVSIKNHYLSKFIRLKNPRKKEKSKFDQSFSYGLFPSVLKTSKIIPVRKKLKGRLFKL